MIMSEVFTKQWIDSKSKVLGLGKKQANPELVEKVTKAFHLLECLVESGLNFIFKGGTSTSLLLIDRPQRFSIDIDIIIEKKVDGIESIFTDIVSFSQVFTHYEEVLRKNSHDIPKQHYKFFYSSVIDNSEKYILLDILYEKNNYEEIVERRIYSDFIDFIQPIRSVYMPSADCLLGDKLTAFAPNTTGVKYNVDKELEIIKQLFDIGNLFALINDISIVRNTFISIANHEIQYRKLDGISYIDILNDIFKTASIISFRNSNIEHFSDLEKGIQMIRNYIFTRKYNVEDAVESASRVAYLALVLKYDLKKVAYYDKKIDLKDFRINSPKYKKLNSIKSFSPEGFFYWFKAIELLDIYEQPKSTYNFTIPPKGISF